VVGRGDAIRSELRSLDEIRSFVRDVAWLMAPAQLSQAMADPIVDEKATTETSITMDGNAYLIHTSIAATTSPRSSTTASARA
jgi:hypothetical protein